MPTPIRPAKVLVDKFLDKWSALENYKYQEDSLYLLFQQYCPENTDIAKILLKVSALNDFYSTNIFDTYAVSKHILNLKIDEALNNTDLGLVNIIAETSIAGKKHTFYSFASKYCAHHKPENYPIYDSYVDNMLWHYYQADGFHEFSKLDLKQYKKFVSVIEGFRTYYELREYSLRQIDIFLWLYGKECMPKAYGKKKELKNNKSSIVQAPIKISQNSVRPVYKLTLQKTYFDHGFFNLGVEVEKYVRPDNGPAILLLGNSCTSIEVKINRSANLNGTPRVYGGTELRNWLQRHYRKGQIVDVQIMDKKQLWLK